MSLDAADTSVGATNFHQFSRAERPSQQATEFPAEDIALDLTRPTWREIGSQSPKFASCGLLEDEQPDFGGFGAA
jgi:hypothetical protein